MNGCNSDPSEGCDNSQLIVTLNNNSSEQVDKLDAINSKLTDINTAIVNCCNTIGSKLDTMNSHLLVISNKL